MISEVVEVPDNQVGLITLLFMYVVCLLFYAIGGGWLI